MLSKEDKSLIGILEKRQQALFRRVEALREEIAGLPKGTVQIKTRGQRLYVYVQYREGRKVRCEYRGLAGPQAENLKRAVLRRQMLEKNLRACVGQLKRVHRVLWAMTPKQSIPRETAAETLSRNYAHAQYIRSLQEAVT